MDGGSWNYENKDIYVRSALMGSLVAGTAFIAPFFATGRWTGLAALMIGFVGYRHLEWLTSLI